jgi:hypothetical protein
MLSRIYYRRMVLLILSVVLVAFFLSAPPSVWAAPTNVTIAGDLQSELGCAGDWDPACPATHLTYDANDDVWQGSWTLPAGNWQYKAAINDSWTENYGLHAIQGGANIPLALSATTTVKFYYDDKTHWVTDNVDSVIATVPGSFQSELGCSGDWDPGCLRSWLQDPDGNGIYEFQTTALPMGNYEAKVAINESWTENYGQGGVPNGPNIQFVVPVNNIKVAFRYDSSSHILTIGVASCALGDLVWYDLNRNGIQDVGEPGIQNVTVLLQDDVGNVIATSTTDAAGFYGFSGLLPGSYRVRFVLPSGYSFTMLHAGSDDTRDSDADPATGLSPLVTLADGEINNTIDAGMYHTAAVPASSNWGLALFFIILLMSALYVIRKEGHVTQ